MDKQIQREVNLPKTQEKLQCRPRQSHHHPQLPASTGLSIHLSSPKAEHTFQRARRTTPIHKLDPQDYVRGSSGARFTEFRRIERSLPRKMFLEGPRCSSLDMDHDLEAKEKDNLTTELTQLAFNSQTKNSDKSPHETVEDFFLINDSTTVCTELPVFHKPEGTTFLLLAE